MDGKVKLKLKKSQMKVIEVNNLVFSYSNSIALLLGHNKDYGHKILEDNFFPSSSIGLRNISSLATSTLHCGLYAENVMANNAN